MSFVHGSKAVTKIATQDVTSYVKQADLADMFDKAETTTMGLTSKTYIPGLKDGTFKISGPHDPTGTALVRAALGTSVAWEFAPNGTATGQKKYSWTGFLTNWNLNCGVDSVESWSADCVVSGGITEGTY